MAKKLVAFLLAVVVAVSISGGSVSAVTIDELLAQIAALQAQILALQAQQQGTGSTCLTKDLKYGMKDDEVKVLQGWLSVSPQSGWFGPLTKAAVITYQKANSITPAVGYFGPITRASANAKYCVSASPSPSVSPVPAGSVSIALSPETPAAGTFVADTISADGAQALVPVSAFRFTAPAAGAVKVTKVIVTRTGIAADADISNMYLFVDSVKVAESPSVSSAKSTFVNSSGIFTIPAGTYKDVVVKIDLANGVTSGKTFQFGIVAASDITSDATVIAGTFPMTGNVFSVATVTDLGKMTIASVAPASNTTVDAGTLAYEAWRFSATGADQPIDVSFVKFTVVGTADYDSLQNLKLYVDGVQVGTTVALMDSNKTVTFDLSAAPVHFASGQVKTFAVRVDVVKGSSRNFYFEVANGSDFVAKDATYGLYLKTNQQNVFTLIKSAGTVSINAGISVSTKSTSSPSGAVTANAINVKLAEWDVKASGEDIRVSTLGATYAGTHTINNVYMTIDGTQYGTKAGTVANTATQAFNGSYIFTAGATKKVAIYADLTSAVVSGDSVLFTLALGAGNGVLQTSGTGVNVPTGAVAANTLSVSAGTVSASKNSSIGNISTVVGATNILVGSWLITAPTDQGVKVNGVTIVDNGNAVGLGDAFDQLTMWSSGTQYGQTISAPSASVGASAIFSLGTQLPIAAGQTIQVDLRANILSNASTDEWAGGAEDAVEISSIDATGNVTNSAVTFAAASPGQLLTLKTGATLTIAAETIPTMPDSSYLVAGDTLVTLGAFRFTADNTENVLVTRVVVEETGAADVPGNFKNIKLFVGGVQVGATAPAFVDAASNTVTFSDAAGLFTVPKNDYKALVVKADMTDKTNATFGDAGKEMKVSIYFANGVSTDTTNISAKGSTSGAYATLAGGDAYLNGSAMTFVRSKPLFAYVAPSSTTLVPGTMEVLRFRITAHSDDDVKFLGTTASSNIRLTVLAGKAASTGTVDLYDASNNALLSQQPGASLATADFVALDFATSTQTMIIPAGTTKEYYVMADLSTFGALGNSFQLKIANAADDISFNDSSAAAADISAANYVNVGLPITGAIFVKP